MFYSTGSINVSVSISVAGYDSAHCILYLYNVRYNVTWVNSRSFFYIRGNPALSLATINRSNRVFYKENRKQYENRFDYYCTPEQVSRDPRSRRLNISFALDHLFRKSF